MPVVAGHPQEIAEHFYRYPFTVHPELPDGTFNWASQAEPTRQEALAEAVARFASALANTPDHLPARTYGTQLTDSPGPGWQ